jgi:glutaminyl-tRNA synthetase
MPTISGMRRRGYTPAAIRNFCDMVGVARSNSVVEIAMLEHAIRDDLNQNAPRAMAVLDPLPVVIENYPEGQVEEFEVPNHPQRPEMGTRWVSFSRVIAIEREDFMEDAPKKFFRLAPGREVRLLGTYYLTCTKVVKDEAGNIIELRCTYDPESRGGQTPDGRKVRGTLHWVSSAHALPAEVRLYDTLFLKENPSEVEKGKDFTSNLNPNSLQVLLNCLVEPGLAGAQVSSRFQFLRQGYFCVDPDSTADKLVFNRTVSLRDSWGKVQEQ